MPAPALLNVYFAASLENSMISAFAAGVVGVASPVAAGLALGSAFSTFGAASPEAETASDLAGVVDGTFPLGIKYQRASAVRAMTMMSILSSFFMQGS